MKPEEGNKEISIPEGNKLIELYYNPENSVDGDWIIWHDSHRTRQHISTLKYHEDWNALMRVLEKISDCHYPNYHGKDKVEDYSPYDDCAYPRTFGMRDDNGYYMVRINASALFISKSWKKATWLAVIDFIQWYNQNKQP